MERELKKLERTYISYEKALDELEVKVRELCDFNARVTFCEGDRHLLLNEDTSTVSRFHCLNGKSNANKLTVEEHENNSL